MVQRVSQRYGVSGTDGESAVQLVSQQYIG